MFISVIPEAEATGALADWYASERKAWGFLPDYAGCFATRPDVAAAWSALASTVRSGMDRRRYELATLGAAGALRSTYCTVAHASFLRDVCGDAATVEAIARHPEALSEVDAAVLGFAAKVAVDAASVQQEDVDALRALGLTDADVADVVMAAAARAFFTRVLDGLGAQLDPQTAAGFAPEILAPLVVGRPVGS